MIVYKLTDENGWTRNKYYNGHDWFKEPMLEVSGRGPLCTDGWIHAYEDPLLAVIMDPIHGAYLPGGRLWVCNAFGKVNRVGQLLLGTDKLIRMGEIPVPTVTEGQRGVFLLYVGLACSSNPRFIEWANGALKGVHISKHEHFTLIESFDRDSIEQRIARSYALTDRYMTPVTLSYVPLDVDLIECAKKAKGERQ